MIIVLEVLKKLKQKITIVFYIILISQLSIVFLSVIGSFADRLNGITTDISSSSQIFNFIGNLFLIIFAPILVVSIFRYIYLSYFHLEASLLKKTKYHPNLYFISICIPIIQLIYPYKYLQNMLNEYSYDILQKRNNSLIFLQIISILLFLLNEIIDIFNYLKKINIQYVNIQYIFVVLIIILFGVPYLKYINELYKIQSIRFESMYSIIEQE